MDVSTNIQSLSVKQNHIPWDKMKIDTRQHSAMSLLKQNELYSLKSFKHIITNYLVVFICLVWLTSIQIHGINAGYACLSNPCLNGVCIDDLNR